MYYQRNNQNAFNMPPMTGKVYNGFQTYNNAPLQKADNEMYPIAMAYVPWQTWDNLYCPKEALKNGTMFCDLDKKFCG